MLVDPLLTKNPLSHQLKRGEAAEVDILTGELTGHTEVVLCSLLHYGLHNCVFEVPVPLTVRIVGLDHHHIDEFLLWVDPEVGAVGSVPAEAASRNAAARAAFDTALLVSCR